MKIVIVSDAWYPQINGVDVSDLGVVDVAANHPVGPAFARRRGEGAFEVVDIFDRVLDAVLEKRGQRPVGIAQSLALHVVPVVDGQHEVVGPVDRKSTRLNSSHT